MDTINFLSFFLCLTVSSPDGRSSNQLASAICTIEAAENINLCDKQWEEKVNEGMNKSKIYTEEEGLHLKMKIKKNKEAVKWLTYILFSSIKGVIAPK